MSKNKWLRNVTGLLLFGSVFLAAAGEEAWKGSGFLKDYSGFQESKRDKSVRVYFKPGTTVKDLKNYGKLTLDPIQVWVHPDAEYKGLDPNELKKLTDYLHDAIVKAMQPDYPIVDNPGDGVLRLRIAITGVVPMDPKHSALSYLPIALVFRGAKAATHAAGGKEEVELEASIEGEFIDTQTNDRMIAFSDKHRGETVTVEEGTTEFEWEYTKKALDFWAKTLRERFDEAHGKIEDPSKSDFPFE